jgi:hypothetical protein
MRVCTREIVPGSVTRRGYERVRTGECNESMYQRDYTKDCIPGECARASVPMNVFERVCALVPAWPLCQIVDEGLLSMQLPVLAYPVVS